RRPHPRGGTRHGSRRPSGSGRQRAADRLERRLQVRGGARRRRDGGASRLRAARDRAALTARRAEGTMPFSEIRTEVADGISTDRVHGGEEVSGFTATMMREMIEAFDQTDADDAVRVVIVTGAGRGFCAGADLSGGGGTFDYRDAGALAEHRDGGGLVALRIFESGKPVIAAVNGPAGGGAVQG